MNRLLVVAVMLIGVACTKNRERKSSSLTEEGIPVCYAKPTTDSIWFTMNAEAPLLEGVSGVGFKISSPSKEAQSYFNQGLMLSYGFNHAEAARSFFQSIRADSTCAMCWWGLGYVLGPNYNGGMDDSNIPKAWKAVSQARSLISPNLSEKEKMLIRALTNRYSSSPLSDRSELDVSYANAMKQVYQKFKSDPDISVLYAESLMDLHPWDLYEKNTGNPRSWTPEIITLLEKVLREFPTHPGGHHLYIHAIEASPTPEKALASAKALDTLVPRVGHLIHMPSHIYINTGDYHEATLSNLRAIEADSIYFTSCHAQGVYPLAYFPHNYHFLAATATLEGNSSLAWTAAVKVQDHTAQELMRVPGWGTLQHYFSIPYYIAVKFSMWDRLLSLPPPPNDLVYPSAVWHYARGMAYLGKNQVAKAKTESEKLNQLRADTSLIDITIWDINTAADLVAIAAQVLKGGILAKEGDLQQSADILSKAVEMEDILNYNEPPDWFFSVRHHLGAVLLKDNKVSEAEKVYRKDLATWKRNGWAYIGLYHSLVRQKKMEEATQVLDAFNLSWKHADVKLDSSSDIAD